MTDMTNAAPVAATSPGLRDRIERGFRGDA
jgi:hypothetical protein